MQWPFKEHAWENGLGSPGVRVQGHMIPDSDGSERVELCRLQSASHPLPLHPHNCRRKGRGISQRTLSEGTQRVPTPARAPAGRPRFPGPRGVVLSRALGGVWVQSSSPGASGETVLLRAPSGTGQRRRTLGLRAKGAAAHLSKPCISS